VKRFGVMTVVVFAIAASIVWGGLLASFPWSTGPLP
jgi:hypothetical protein